MPKPFLPVIGLIMLSQAATAQDSMPDSSYTRAAYNNAVNYYHKYTDKQARLYNGFLHIGYSHKIEGFAYYPDVNWQKGTVVYDGISFPDVSMMYDTYKDELVIQHFHRLMVTLHSEKIKEFKFGNMHFVRFERDSTKKSSLNSGFYQLMHKGKLSFVVKRQKLLEETITDVLVQRFIPKNFYYINRNDTWHNIRNFDDLRNVFKERSKEIRQQFKKNKIKFRKDKEGAILLAVQYIDSITQ